MRAAVVTAKGLAPVFTKNHPKPVLTAGTPHRLIRTRAAALTHLTKMKAMGTHYSAVGSYPLVPGIDGVGIIEGTQQRVYFLTPEAPTGAMSEYAIVSEANCIPIPEGLDDVTAAAVANPGMSAMPSLLYRAKIQPGETVLINGATGIAGSICTQLAKHLGAANIIVAGRGEADLQKLIPLGATHLVPFDLDAPKGFQKLEAQLVKLFKEMRIDAVIDYLYGQSALAILQAAVKGAPAGYPLRFVQVGSAAGKDSLEIPAGLLRSSGVELMGSGFGSTTFANVKKSIEETFKVAATKGLSIDTTVMSLEEVEKAWAQKFATPRVVFQI